MIRKPIVSDIRVHEKLNEDGSTALMFAGIKFPERKDEVVPLTQNILIALIDALQLKSQEGMQFIDLNEVIGMLQLIQDMVITDKS